MPQENFDLLARIVAEIKGPPGWSFELRDEDGAKRLVITLDTKSNYPPHYLFRVAHYHPVPVAVYNEASWQRWIFDQCIRTQHHEIGEALRFAGKRPFAPCHGPGEDPYAVHDNRSSVERRTMQDGSVRPAGGSRVPQDGSVRPAGGSRVPQDGSVRPAGGSKVPQDGSVRPPSGKPARAPQS